MNYAETKASLIKLLESDSKISYAKACANEIKHDGLAKEHAGIRLATAARLADVYRTRARRLKKDNSFRGLDAFVEKLDKLSSDARVAVSEVVTDKYLYNIFTDLSITKLFGLIRIDISKRLRSNRETDVGLKMFVERLRSEKSDGSDEN